MHKIYQEYRCIIICSPGEPALSDPNAVEFHFGGRIDIGRLVAMFRASESLSHIYIPTDDIESTYRQLCSEFREVNAAGGLVTNRRGDFLMINRNGRWDLPKGHQEAGEDIRVTAVREVMEETGVQPLIPGDLVCITDHCYFRNNVWHLKHTWWFSMKYNMPIDLIPQREEDISVAAWVAKSSLPSCLEGAFPSISEVFREARV